MIVLGIVTLEDIHPLGGMRLRTDSGNETDPQIIEIRVAAQTVPMGQDIVTEIRIIPVVTAIRIVRVKITVRIHRTEQPNLPKVALFRNRKI